MSPVGPGVSETVHNGGVAIGHQQCSVQMHAGLCADDIASHDMLMVCLLGNDPQLTAIKVDSSADNPGLGP